MAGSITLKTKKRSEANSVLEGATLESPWVRWTLTAVAVLFLALFIFMPLAVVFFSAFAKGVGAYFASFRDPDALAAIRLTLLAAGIAVPMNLVFGVAAAWGRGQIRICRQEPAGDSDRSSLLSIAGDLGPGLRPDLRTTRTARTLAARARHQDYFLPCRESYSPRSS
jgi:hypothetical protein